LDGVIVTTVNNCRITLYIVSVIISVSIPILLNKRKRVKMPMHLFKKMIRKHFSKRGESLKVVIVWLITPAAVVTSFASLCGSAEVEKCLYTH
jgi:UDP-N-acetylmuramyl pentapeptide phosphotransferase/UDP-N-acetylglucosamine-1-phosphate transferase